MDRIDFVLATMSSFPNQSFSPVQVQKFFFLLDENLPALGDTCPEGVPFFAFQPYDYGPFDSSVYGVLDQLSHQGFVRVIGDSWNPRRAYEVTGAGNQRGQDLLSKIHDSTQLYIKKLGDWVLSLSFTQLISAIYQIYPDMKENSVFRE